MNIMTIVIILGQARRRPDRGCGGGPHRPPAGRAEPVGVPAGGFPLSQGANMPGAAPGAGGPGARVLAGGHDPEEARAELYYTVLCHTIVL